jgi:hypothetical protein
LRHAPAARIARRPRGPELFTQLIRADDPIRVHEQHREHHLSARRRQRQKIATTTDLEGPRMPYSKPRPAASQGNPLTCTTTPRLYAPVWPVLSDRLAPIAMFAALTSHAKEPHVHYHAHPAVAHALAHANGASARVNCIRNTNKKGTRHGRQ